MTDSEQLLTRTLLWATAGAACAVPVLVLPQPQDPLLTMTIHLGFLVLFGVALAFHLAPLTQTPWFADVPLGRQGRTALTWIVVAVQAATVCGIVALATSAAFRYDASLQFLILIAVLGTVATTTLTVLGVRRRFGGTVALWAAILIGGLGVVAIWRYGDRVGFTPAGGWQVDGSEVVRIIVPLDLIRWAAALTALSLGVRRGDD